MSLTAYRTSQALEILRSPPQAIAATPRPPRLRYDGPTNSEADYVYAGMKLQNTHQEHCQHTNLSHWHDAL